MLELIVRDAVGSMSEDERKGWWESRVEWCCPGRHGVMRNVTESDIGKARHVVSWYFGAYDNDGLWWRKEPDGTWSCEFTHMCKVQPAPDFPWDWCGKTILFEDWQRIEQALANIRGYIARNFAVGTVVTYRDADGATVAVGQLSRVNEKSFTINDFALGSVRIPYDTTPGWCLT